MCRRHRAAFRFGRLLALGLVTLGAVGIAGAQFFVARRGMVVSASADGLDGIGVAAAHAVGGIALTLAAVLLGSRLLDARGWLRRAALVGAADFTILVLSYSAIDVQGQRSWPGATAFVAALVLPCVTAFVVAGRPERNG